MLTEISGIDTNINGNAVSSQGVVHQLWQISIYRHYWRCAQAKKTLPPQYWEPNIKRLNEVQSVKIPRPRKCFFSRFRWQSCGKGAAATILSPFSRCRLTNHGLNQQPAARALIFTSPRTLSSALQSVSIQALLHHTLASVHSTAALIQAGNALEPTVSATHRSGRLSPTTQSSIGHVSP